MKEISYRAWLKDEKKMVEVKSIHFGTKKIIYGYSENSHSYGNVSCKFDDCELMQYTGLEDKNGKKIFDGDIVIGYFPYGEKGVVVWDEKRCGFYILPYWEHGVGRASNDKYYKMNATKLEVIGNVYDNPIYLK